MIVWGEMTVMFLHGADLITEPNGYFVDAFTRGDQETGERVPHDVWRHPGAFLRAHVAHKGHAEIVTIKPFSVGNVGSEHERSAQAIRRKECLKLTRQWNRSFFTIFEMHRRRLAKIQQPVGEIEPKRAGFDNFLESQTRVETAEKNEFQFIRWRFANELVAQIVRAKILARSSGSPGNLHLFDRITAGDSSNFHGPTEEGSQRHGVTERGRIGRATESSVVKLLYLPSAHGRSRCIRWKARRKQEKLVALGHSCGAGVFLLASLVSDKPGDLGNERRTRFEEKVFSEKFRFPDSFRRVGSLQRDPRPRPVFLDVQPVGAPSKIDSTTHFPLFFAHRGRLSHIECHTFKKIIGDIVFYGLSIVGNEPLNQQRKTLLRRWLRVQVPPNPYPHLAKNVPEAPRRLRRTKIFSFIAASATSISNGISSATAERSISKPSRVHA